MEPASPDKKYSYLFGALSGFMMIMSVALIVLLSFAVTNLFFQATAVTGYFKNVIYYGSSAPNLALNYAGEVIGAFLIIFSMWKCFLLFAVIGTGCSYFRQIDNRKGLYFPLYVFKISRTSLYWFSVCFATCAGYAVIRLRHIIYIDTLWNGASYYSFWFLAGAYLLLSGMIGSILNQTWLFFYRLFSRESTPDETIDLGQ